MVRTVISLEKKDHEWLLEMARSEQVSMAEIIRSAIEQYRYTRPHQGHSDLEKAVNATKGIWKKGDGLNFQKQIRSEWR